MASEFCVVCGRTDVPTTDGVCATCFAKRTSLVHVEGRPVVTLCPTCGARRIGQLWDRRGSSDLLTPDDLTPLLVVHPEVGIRRVRWSEGGKNPLVRDLEASIDLVFRDEPRTETLKFGVKIDHRTCPDCSRRSGHFYTAIIQLRGEENGREKPPELRARLDRQWSRILPEARKSWKEALSWKEELPEGWDFYVTDTLAARSLARLGKSRLRGELKESATLWGRKHGVDVYRVTFCLRVAPEAERPGDAPPTTGRTAGLRANRRSKPSDGSESGR
ncbi:MAG TPA: NMD3-related protein [Thermoplasmata archaeon]|nr:NMD3-related protein [Thermoplasmata archaeon]